jgi:hypothetical protein
MPTATTPWKGLLRLGSSDTDPWGDMDPQQPTGPWQPQQPQPQPPRRRRSVWQVVGVTLAVVVGVMGLVAVAGAILFMVAINSWADNK